MLALGLHTGFGWPLHGHIPAHVPPKARPATKGMGAVWSPVGGGPDLPGLNASCHGIFEEQPLPRWALLRKVSCSCFQALYDHLMDFLADRGVDNTFADELIELSTALEHQEYIKFLEDLKSFVKCQ